MITCARIANFKAVGRLQRVPIRPLTLVYGANSAGKSSIVQSLFLAQRALALAETPQIGSGEQRAPDLGTYRDWLHAESGDSANATRITTVGLEGDGPPFWSVYAMEGESSFWSQGPRPIDRRLIQDSVAAYYPGRTGSWSDRTWARVDVGIGPRGIRSVTFGDRSGTVVAFEGDDRGIYRLDRLALDHPLLSLVSPETAAAARGVLTLRLEAGLHSSDAESLVNWEDWTPSELRGHIPDFPGDVEMEIDTLVQRGLSLLASTCRSLRYVGPVRPYPPRGAWIAAPESAEEADTWRDDSWRLLVRDDEARATVNSWLTRPDRLGQPYSLEVSDLYGANAIMGDLPLFLDNRLDTVLDEIGGAKPDPHGDRSAIEAWASEVVDRVPPGMGDAVSDWLSMGATQERAWRLMNIRHTATGRFLSPRDVGTGISQILPVLTYAAASRGRVLVVEQPEIHLHPALQAELADLLLESSLGERRNTLLIETHSEHLLLRVMRRMRETHDGRAAGVGADVTPEDVSVVFVESDGEGCAAREMPLNERGELVKAWPGGFFEEGIREVF